MCAHLLFDLVAKRLILLQKLLHLVAALSQTIAVIAEPRAALFDNIRFHGIIDDFADTGNALAIENVEYNLFKRRRNLVLYDFAFCLVADNLRTVLGSVRRGAPQCGRTNRI